MFPLESVARAWTEFCPEPVKEVRLSPCNTPPGSGGSGLRAATAGDVCRKIRPKNSRAANQWRDMMMFFVRKSNRAANRRPSEPRNCSDLPPPGRRRRITQRLHADHTESGLFAL